MSDINKSKRILNRSYADLLVEVLEYIITHDDQSEALRLSRNLSRAVNDNSADLKLQPQLLNFYKEAITKLQFICLPSLDDKEVISLIKNDFNTQLAIPDYDLLQKIKMKILNIITIDDRNKFKEDLRRVISESGLKITTKPEVRMARDWVKDYVSKIGIDGGNKLAKAQYLVSLRNDKNISPKEYNNLILLFNLYDELNMPADSPEGFSEEIPIIIKGKLYIFRRGVLEPVLENKAVDQAMALVNGNQPASDPTHIITSPLIELEQTLKDYPSDSLEHKAIKQEINRLKVAAFKQAQKTNVKK